MEVFPKSANETVSGLRYFGRVLDKIQLHARGELHSDYHKNLGHPQAAAAIAAASRSAGEKAETAQLIRLGLKELAK